MSRKLFFTIYLSLFLDRYSPRRGGMLLYGSPLVTFGSDDLMNDGDDIRTLSNLSINEDSAAAGLDDLDKLFSFLIRASSSAILKS